MTEERKGVEILGGSSKTNPKVGVKRMTGRGTIENKQPEILDKHPKKAEEKDGA